MKYSRARRDGNQKAIVDFLRKHGADVIDLAAVGEVPDLLVYYRGFTCFIEVKRPGNNIAFKRVQVNWIAQSKFNVAICTTEEQALQTMQQKLPPLTQKQKDNLAVYVRNNLQANYSSKNIMNVLNPNPQNREDQYKSDCSSE